MEFSNLKAVNYKLKLTFLFKVMTEIKLILKRVVKNKFQMMK